MSCAEVFSYALALKGANRMEQILELIEEGRREEIRTALEPLKGVPPEAIRQLWRERRKSEEEVLSAMGESCRRM